MKPQLMEKQSRPDTFEETSVFQGRKKSSTMHDTGLLVLRLTMGGLITGHGAQKLFGWFSGPGLKGMAGWLESIGLKPGTPWATAASASEFGGGALTTLGFLHPLGPLSTIGAMLMATVKVHKGKPIWASQGGAELPLIYTATALALTFTGPGRFSLDRMFGIRLPRALAVAFAIAEAAAVTIGIMTPPAPPPASLTEKQAKTTVAAGSGTGKA